MSSLRGLGFCRSRFRSYGPWRESLSLGPSRSDDVTVAVGFIPRIKVRQSGRRVATRESRVEAGLQPSLRDEGSLFAIIRGLKSTATIVPSLRDAPAAAGEPLKAPEDWRS